MIKILGFKKLKNQYLSQLLNTEDVEFNLIMLLNIILMKKSSMKLILFNNIIKFYITN